MKYLRAVLFLVPVLLALSVGTAAAKQPPAHPGLDPTYGHGGTNTVSVPAPKNYVLIRGFAVAPDGRAYVLQNSHLFAFEADGKVAHDFGKNGRIVVASTAGEGEPTGLAVDSQGRILVTGTASQAYVIRFLPDGSRDASFGNSGEVDTDFGLPQLPASAYPWRPWGERPFQATKIFVDANDRPIVGGGFLHAPTTCGGYVHAPFVARLTTSGALDPTFGGGYALPDGLGEVTAIGEVPGGGLATLSRGLTCGPREEQERSRLSVFTETGAPSGILDPGRPVFYMAPTMALDPSGRIFVIQSPEVYLEPPGALVRLLPNGDVDSGFGQNGGMALTAGLTYMGWALAVDGKGRPILAGGKGRIELRRLGTMGKIDRAFGPNGRLTAAGPAPEAVALDGRGRIYTVSRLEDPSLKTGAAIEVARFIPGS